MTLVFQSRRLLRRIIYGDTSIPQEFTVALAQPQNEVVVFLECGGMSLDVTDRHTTACCAPFVLGISVDAARAARILQCRNASLAFLERASHRVLGVIRLTPKGTIAVDQLSLILFTVLGSTNYCLPRLRLWAHYLPEAFTNWRKLSGFDVRMSHREIRASQVAFIRPHPLMLGSLNGSAGGNMFPMNLMGDLGEGHFAFALKDSRRAAHLVERTGSIALSNVPPALCAVAFRFAIHHTRDGIDWDTVPFALRRSRELGIPVPASSSRVRELRVAQVHRLGSHTLFVARIIADDWRTDEPPVHIVHGFYQHWRLRNDKAKLRKSVLEDALHKKGVPA